MKIVEWGKANHVTYIHLLSLFIVGFPLHFGERKKWACNQIYDDVARKWIAWKKSIGLKG